MSSFSAGYLIIFIPLISALISFLASFSKSNFIIFISSLLAVFILGFKLLFDVLAYGKIADSLELGLISIATEYNIDLLAICFLLAIIFIKIITAFFYKADIDQTFDKEARRLFYTVNSLNLFAIIGILNTNNILNLYIFIEIYSLTFYALSSVTKELDTARIAFKYFCQSVVGGALMLIAFFSLYIITGSYKIDQMMYNIKYLHHNNYIIAVLLLALSVAGIILKFFPLWLDFSKSSKDGANNNFIANFLNVSTLFIKGNIGLYLLIKLIFFLFGTNFVFAELKLNLLLLLIGSVMVFYSSIKLLTGLNLKTIAGYLYLSNLGLIFIATGLNSHESLIALFFYVINFSFVVLLTFLFACYLSRNFANCQISCLHIIRRNNILVGVPLKIIVFFIAGFPLTALFIGNWHLLYSVMDFDIKLFAAVPVAVAFLVALKLAITMLNYFYFYSSGEEIILERGLNIKANNFLYLTCFWLIAVVCLLCVIYNDNLNNIAGNLAIYLLY